ncbi:MAG: YjcQ family protein [Lactobacillus sp.]|nr:YjcQ family protein [Lactobacillus sp.]
MAYVSTLSVKILKYLEECYKKNEVSHSSELNYQKFGVSELDFLNTLKELSGEALIQGFVYSESSYSTDGISLTTFGLYCIK